VMRGNNMQILRYLGVLILAFVTDLLLYLMAQVVAQSLMVSALNGTVNGNLVMIIPDIIEVAIPVIGLVIFVRSIYKKHVGGIVYGAAMTAFIIAFALIAKYTYII
jgi:hypothetical protein